MKCQGGHSVDAMKMTKIFNPLRGKAVCCHALPLNMKTKKMELFPNNCSFCSDDMVYVAQHNFQPTNDTDLPFKKGDKLRVLEE